MGVAVLVMLRSKFPQYHNRRNCTYVQHPVCSTAEMTAYISKVDSCYVDLTNIFQVNSQLDVEEISAMQSKRLHQFVDKLDNLH